MHVTTNNHSCIDTHFLSINTIILSSDFVIINYLGKDCKLMCMCRANI